MPIKLPPAPSGSPPGSSFWNDWYEKLRTLINSGTISQLWSSIDFSGSNITDIATRAHNNLQSFQGGTAGEYYHLTQAQNTTIAALPTLTSGTYTPTLTNTTNVASSTSYQAQYLRVGSVVTVSGRVNITPTAATTNTVLGLSLPIASNFTALENCGGSGAGDVIADRGAAVRANTTTDTAEIAWQTNSTTARTMYYSYTYLIV